MTGYCETPSLHPVSETLQVIYKPVMKGGKAFVYKMSKAFTLICALPGTRSLSLALPQLGHETAGLLPQSRRTVRPWLTQL